jgi:hypothetical protein
MPSRIRSAVRAATEVPRKYATRYRSVAAWELQRKGKRVRMGGSCRPRACMDSRPPVAVDCSPRRMPRAMEAVFCAIQGCVVTKAEHQRLKPFDATHAGWARYIAAGVPVIDTSTGNQGDLSALEAGSTDGLLMFTVRWTG